MGQLDNILEEIQKVELDVNIISEIRQRINEELSINNEVRQASFKLIETINEHMKSVPKQYFANINGTSYRIGDLKETILNTTINIHYRLVNFKDKHFYEMAIDKLPSFPNSYNKKTNTLSLDIISISGNIDQNTYVDTIQHEIEHMFQENKRDKPFNEDALYKMAMFLKTNFIDDKVAYRIGDLLYFTRQCENDAYVNGLYSLLVDNYKEHRWATFIVIHGSPLYKGLMTMRQNRKWLEENKENEQVKSLFKSINTQVHLTVDKLIKMVDGESVYTFAYVKEEYFDKWILNE